MIRRWNPAVRAALERVSELFSPDTRSRGVARSYFDYLWTAQEVLRVLGRDRLDGLHVCDVGCGGGVYALLLRELGAAVAAVDTFAEYAERCDNQMGQAGEIIARMEGRGITVRRSDIMVEPIPAADASCDVATLFAVIEHLHGSPARVMRELHRILKPGGFVFLTAPNIAWIRTRLRLLFGRTVHPPYEEWWREPYYSHVREPTLRELRCALEWSGFEVVHTAYGNYAHASARLSGEPPRWTPSFQLRTGRQVMVALSNLVTALVPSMRFTLLAAGRRPPH